MRCFLSVPVKKRPRKRNFKDVEIEAKNGDLGLGHGHGRYLSQKTLRKKKKES